ncbi:MAG: hypothetical protein LBS21_01480 [Clostridiales bacterium]|jgi:hypothetical protein|nr:hypothetical protein [Clostridiales bacterium]
MMQELTQEMKNFVSDMIRDVHTAVPGKIVSFDPEKNEAAVQPTAKFRKPDGTQIDFAQINHVPVMFMQSAKQTATLVYPVRKDDECLILFSEQALDQWRTGAEASTELRFDLTNAVAVVGLFVKPNPLIKEACTDDSLIVEKDGQRLRLKTGETYIRDTFGQSITLTPKAIDLKGANINLTAESDISLTAKGNINIKAEGAVNIEVSGTKIGLTSGGVEINGDITHAGSMITSGTHKDAAGTHV